MIRSKLRLMTAGLLVAVATAGCKPDITEPASSTRGMRGPSLALVAGDITVSVLPSPAGVSVNPQGVSPAGYIYGAATNSSDQYVPYFWQSPYDQPAAPMAVGGFAATWAGTNDFGDVAGQLPSGTSYVHGYFAPNAGSWDFNEVSTGGLSSVSVKDINNSRELVGSRSGSAQLALYWSSPTAEPVILPLPAYSGTLSGANTQAINNSGEIVGYALEVRSSGKHSTMTVNHAVIWNRDASGWHATMLPTVSTSDDRAYDINDAGQIVGYSGGGASLWTSVNGVYSGRVIVASQGALSKIDRCGRVIGYSTSARVNGRTAWVWENGNTVYLPNPPGSSGSSASAITTELSTGSGIIVGVGYVKSSRVPARWTLPGCP